MPSKKTKAATNPIVLKPGISIGANAAEDDDSLLFACFEDGGGIFADLEDFDSPRYLLKGRTGAGKTAFLRYLERKHNEKVIRVDPEFLCLRYISNSDIMQYLAKCGVNLEPFFQIIWRHAFCSELLKRRYRIDNADKAVGFWGSITKTIQPNKRRAIEYLQSFGVDLWPEMETRVTQIARKVEDELRGQMGMPLGPLTPSLDASHTVTAEESIEVQKKVNRILCAEQLGNLGTVISFLADDVFADGQHEFYIVLDDLDRFVVDDGVRYLLLRALIDSVKKFKPLRGVKFCLAVRSDLLELIFDRTKGHGFQTEKYEDSILEIKWSKKQLFALAESRITEVFRRQYTNKQVHFDDVFPGEIDRKSTRDYLFERTLRRPRDLIAFVNQCFRTAVDKDAVRTKALKDAEGLYSEKRLQALVEEWSDAHPSIERYFGPLQHKKAVLMPDAFFGKDVDDLIGALATCERSDADSVARMAKRYYNDDATEWEVLQVWLAALYKFGIVGVKTVPQSPVSWAMSNSPTIPPQTFAVDSHIEIHPMFYRVFGIFPKQH